MPPVSNNELKLLIETLSKDVTMCARTLRGNNGDAGLVANVLLLSDKVEALDKKVSILEQKITNDLVHAIQDKFQDKPTAVKFGSWEWFSERAGMPIVVAITISLLLWFLTEILPQLVGHLGQ